MFYGNSTWDPVLIVAQIISLQCLFYISLGLLLWLLVGALISWLVHRTDAHGGSALWKSSHDFGKR